MLHSPARPQLLSTAIEGRLFLDRYEAMRRLGEGGMGSVYLARDLELREPAVIKVMHPHVADDPVFRARFAREMDLMARFRHPHAVTLFDASLDDGPCIVMEYLPGVTLDRLLARNVRFSPSRLRRLLGQCGAVLQAAHDQGIIHRDLKPANLMVLDPDTPFEKLKVLDFGLAQLTEDDSGPGEGRRREYAVGTPGYMPPEQVSGERMDHRGDLYSLGVIVFQMLTGQLPFVGETSMELLMAQATGTPPTFAELGMADQIPEGIEALLQRCLAADPAHRPDSAQELVDSYEAALAAGYQHKGPEPQAEEDEEEVDHPDRLVDRLEAWMPEQIAVFKVRGYVQELGGQVIDSMPGLIRVRLLLSPAKAPGGLRGWFRTPKPCPLEVELQLKTKDPSRPNLLQITARYHPAAPQPQDVPSDWKDQCSKFRKALRSYLMTKA
jgi:serine/threonine-protein kinase